MMITTSQAPSVPKGWSIVRLADVGSFMSGSGFPLVYQGITSGDIPFFKVSDFSNPGNKRALRRANHYIGEATRREMCARLFPENAIAFAKIGAAIFLERKRIIKQASCLDNNMAAFVLSSPEISRDLILALLQNFSLGSLVSSTALPAISSADLKNIAFPLPDDLKEQEAIAEALSDTDALIEGLERLIAKKRLIKQGAMQELLTGRRRLPGFSGEWVERNLGSVAMLQRGFDLPNSVRTDGDFPVVYSNGIIATHTNFMCEGPGVITGRSGTIGNVTFVQTQYWPHNTALWVKNFFGNDVRFVFYLLQFIDLRRFASGSGVPTLNRNDAHADLVRVPIDVVEQVAIRSILDDINTEIQALETRLEKTQQVKEGMMQNLLTGRIRLV